MSFYIAYWHLYRKKYFECIAKKPEAAVNSQSYMPCNTVSMRSTLAVMQEIAWRMHSVQINPPQIAAMWGVTMYRQREVQRSKGTMGNSNMRVLEVDRLIPAVIQVIRGNFDYRPAKS